MEIDNETVWNVRVMDAAHDFAEKVRILCDETPSESADPLAEVMNDLMTELWDRCFSQTEIRNAFLSALNDLDRYAAGEERRS